VGGIFYGWPAYVFVLKEEKIFYELCENGTDLGPKMGPVLNDTGTTEVHDTIKHCVAQDTFYNMLFVIGCGISNGCGLLFGKSVFSVKILAKTCNFDQKSKFWSKIEILVKNRNFGLNSKFW